MANLPENKLYSPASEPYSSKPITGAVKSLLGNLRSPKAVGISPSARNVSNTVQSMRGPMSGPVAGMSTNYGTVTVPYGGSTRYENFHPGIDIGSPIGTPLNSFTGGRVIESVSGKRQGDRGYGNYVVLVDSQGNKHRYSHLAQNYVKVGQQVPAGFRLGTIGNTGQTYSTSGGTGSHLDYRVRDAYDKYINPARFLKLTGKANR